MQSRVELLAGGLALWIQAPRYQDLPSAVMHRVQRLSLIFGVAGAIIPAALRLSDNAEIPSII